MLAPLVPTLLLVFVALISAESDPRKLLPKNIIDRDGTPEKTDLCESWDCSPLVKGNQKTIPRPADQKAPRRHIDRWNDPVLPVEYLKPVIRDPAYKIPEPVAPVESKKAPSQPAVDPKTPEPVVIIPVVKKPEELPLN